MIQVTHEYITKLESLKTRAELLEAFLGDNAGTTADWPLHMKCDNEVTADQLKSHLQALQDSIKACNDVATR